MPFLAVAFAAVLCALTMPAAAADLDWQIVNGATARDIERQIQRWAASGYRVQAIVADAPGPTVVVARGGGPFRRVPPSAEYRVLDSRDAAQISLQVKSPVHWSRPPQMLAIALPDRSASQGASG